VLGERGRPRKEFGNAALSDRKSLKTVSVKVRNAFVSSEVGIFFSDVGIF